MEAQPSDKLVSNGGCLTQPGQEYVVFQNLPHPFTLNIADAKSALKAEWFNPRTDKRVDAGSFFIDTASLSPPTDWGNVSLVRHL